jgi:protein TonB
MLISKFDLYKSGWLELVFEDRNKAYGAYDLRQHYAGNVVRAMGITFLGIGLLFGAGAILQSHHAVATHSPDVPVVVVHVTELKPLIEPPKKLAEPAKPAPQIKTTAFVPPVVVADQLVRKPPVDNALLTDAIGPTTTDGKPGTNTAIPDKPSTGPGTQPTDDNSVHNTIGLEAMPEPIGGDNAWTKFLNRNLRFPAPAQDEGVSGRVILSFIIEKNGTLSNITVERPAGHGFDEEAVRVLKLAKAWKPGIQNGQAVRVKFMMPINFTLSQDNN